MEVRLHVTQGKSNVREIVLGRETLIGRSSDCNLKITSSQVSRRHCRILVTDREVLVTDLGSANGTLVNGTAIPKDLPSRVAPGNELEIGPLKFQVQYIAPPGSPSDETVKAHPDTLAIVSPKTKPATAAADSETVDFVLDERRRKQLKQAVAKSGEAHSGEVTSSVPKPAVADAPCPNTEMLPAEDASAEADDGEGTVMDLNLFGQPGHEETPQFPVVAVDAVDDTTDLPGSSKSSKARDAKPKEKSGGFFGLFRRKPKDAAAVDESTAAAGTPKKGAAKPPVSRQPASAPIDPEQTIAFGAAPDFTGLAPDATVMLPADESHADQADGDEAEADDEEESELQTPGDDPFGFLSQHG